MTLPLPMLPRAKAIAIAAIACVIALLAGLIGGFLAGREWQLGREARADVATLHADLEEAARTARASAEQFRASAAELDGISRQYQEQRDAAAQFYDGLEADWDHYWRNRPDRDCALNGDGVRLWNAAIRGDTAGLRSPDDPAGLESPLQAPTGDRLRSAPGADAELHWRNDTLRRLFTPSGSADGGDFAT
jgi:hypothetical protein